MACTTGENLAIVVVNYGSSTLLGTLLAPLSAALPQATTIVVDNFSSAEECNTLAVLASEHGWVLVAAESNLGFGAGVNLGVEAAIARGVDALLVLNPDASMTAEAVCVLVERARAAPASLFGPRIERPDGSVWFAGADLHLADGRLRNPTARASGTAVEPWLSGACLVMSIALWQKVGGFDPDYFLYWEDVDLSHRVLQSGGEVVVCDDVVAVHDEGATHDKAPPRGSRRKSDTYYYFVIRNRMLFAAKHLEPARFAAWQRVQGRVALETLLQGGRRQFAHSLGPLLIAWRALRDGRALANAALARQQPRG